MHQNKIPLDSTTLINEIEKKDSIQSIGGVEYLTELINMVPTAANVESYVKIVEDK